MTQQQPRSEIAVDADEADVLDQLRADAADLSHPEPREVGDNEERVEPADDLGYQHDGA